ncbi:pimeloyl-ACP methyl ester carboxylesterase [Haloactinopolyspora alba]|uniref:Pimeloyl-ACP methyl ester carboxylesterase n=1 Tax=Haloactinopolyspora alba TaxID=648780 RepID=A0A2P8EG16_9ACTN|nr:alpha/beta hydrolase [Haloactinopolyspora alba]PSL08413.1 pimeloyl-ACP methyl ester carboxylesterase [Haloactinopolyspora alba]
MGHVMSEDGTRIAFDRLGEGPALVVVGGGLDDGSESAPLATELAERFTVYTYARRGRGDSGDTSPYALERELEDIDALIAAAGGPAHLYGVSSGGALALEAAVASTAIDRVAVYEVPYAMSDDAVGGWTAYVEQLDEALGRGDRAAALEHFMRLAGSSDDQIVAARSTPMWPGLEALAHTLAYDAACLGDGRPPRERLASLTNRTLVVTGSGRDPHTAQLQPGFFDDAADALVTAIPHARRAKLEAQDHVADPAVMAPLLTEFLSSP